jgi:hypothetical protein
MRQLIALRLYCLRHVTIGWHDFLFLSPFFLSYFDVRRYLMSSAHERHIIFPPYRFQSTSQTCSSSQVLPRHHRSPRDSGKRTFIDGWRKRKRKAHTHAHPAAAAAERRLYTVGGIYRQDCHLCQLCYFLASSINFCYKKKNRNTKPKL